MRKNFLKICLLFTFCLLLSGCDVNYDIILNNGIISEKVQLKADNSEVIDKFQTPVTQVVEGALKEYEDNSDKRLLTIKNKSNKKRVLLEITNREQKIEKYDGIIPKNCFQLATVLIEDDQIIFSTSEGAECFDNYLNTNLITVRITTNHKVVEHNADKIQGNTYIWEINKGNYQTKQIQLIVKKEEFVKKTMKLGVIFATIAGVVGVIGMIGLWIYFKSKNANRL